VSDLEQLLNHEASIDRLVEELPILRLPVRLPLSMVLRVLHGLVHGTPLTGVPAKLDAAGSLAARMSHLVPLLANCPGEPTGADARDVLEAYHEVDPDGKQGRLLVSYAHFADLMPEVRRNYFSVAANGKRRFGLSHASKASAEAEAGHLT
jgi:hypothetical protein